MVEIIKEMLKIAVAEYNFTPKDSEVDVDEAIAYHIWVQIEKELNKGEK